MKYNRRDSLKANVISNLILAILSLCVGTLCFAPTNSALTVDETDREIYRLAGDEAKGICLMFNVYWGTDEVYQILQTLEAYEAKATFFIGGAWADDNVDCLKAIAEKGHEIGNHGYFHKAHDKLSFAKNQEEIENCNRFIQTVLGKTPTLFAPPSGAYNDETLRACKALGMKTILWSKDTIDWRDKDAALIYKRATKNVTRGDFILLHPMVETVAALKDILQYYEKYNLETVTVSENLQKEG